MADQSQTNAKAMPAAPDYFMCYQQPPNNLKEPVYILKTSEPGMLARYVHGAPQQPIEFIQFFGKKPSAAHLDIIATDMESFAVNYRTQMFARVIQLFRDFVPFKLKQNP